MGTGVLAAEQRHFRVRGHHTLTLPEADPEGGEKEKRERAHEHTTSRSSREDLKQLIMNFGRHRQVHSPPYKWRMASQTPSPR